MNPSDPLPCNHPFLQQKKKKKKKPGLLYHLPDASELPHSETHVIPKFQKKF
jgi:hypothetical protein